jgi:hypothetical protein
MIRVIYRDGEEDLVAQKFLDILLFVGEVQMFQRNNDWAVVGVDPIRAESRHLFSGEDRRLHQQTDIVPLQMCG